MSTRKNYTELIKEGVDEILKSERQSQDVALSKRYLFLRLLKSGEASTQEQAGRLAGISSRTYYKLWKTYTQEGFSGVAKKAKPGPVCRISAEVEQDLIEECRQDKFVRLQDMVDYLAQAHNISYSVPSMHFLAKRLKVKHKVPRPLNYKQGEGAVEKFKANFF